MLNVKDWLASLIAANKKMQALPSNYMFTDGFMRKNTDYESIDDFLNSFRNNRAMSGTDIDTYVRSNTYFESWADMLHTAYEETFFKQG